MGNSSKRWYEPSRLVVNMGILGGGAIGLLLTYILNLDEVEGFLLTGLCALIGVALLSYGEVFLFRRRS